MGKGKYKNKPTGQRQFSSREDLLASTSTRPRSFSKAFDTLLQKLQRYVPLGASVADWYAGAGVIRLSLAATRKCRSVRCIEINKESKLSFEKTVARLPNIVDSSISWHHTDTSKLRHRRGKLETTRAQYINTKDVRLTITTWNVAGRVPDENLDIDDCISS